MTPVVEVLVRLVVALGLLVVVPLGLWLIDDSHFGLVRRYWWGGGRARRGGALATSSTTWPCSPAPWC